METFWKRKLKGVHKGNHKARVWIMASLFLFLMYYARLSIAFNLAVC